MKTLSYELPDEQMQKLYFQFQTIAQNKYLLQVHNHLEHMPEANFNITECTPLSKKYGMFFRTVPFH